MNSNMPDKLRNILALIAGLLGGMIANSTILSGITSLIPLPVGTDTSSMEGLAAAIPQFSPEHFVAPFAAHALGTLIGCIIALWIGTGPSFRLVLPISLFFLTGGIFMVYYLDAPLWFDIIDLVIAYLPMGWLATQIWGYVVRARRTL